MACSKELVDNISELTTCSICLETFKSPVFLPCLHTFCKPCISSYISSTNLGHDELEKQDNSFQCPICRKSVTLGTQDSKDKTLADNLPFNHFMVSLMDSIAIGQKEKLCDSCLIQNESSKSVSFCVDCSEALCSACVKCHRSFKITRGHEIVDIDNMSSTKLGMYYAMCSDHNEAMKMYCVDHNAPCCTVCDRVKHRKCENVVTLEHVAKGVRDSKDTLDLSASLDDVVNDISKEITEVEKEMAMLDQTAADIESEVKRTSQVLRDNVSKKEASLLKELKSVHTTARSKQKGTHLKLQTLHSALDNCRKLLKASTTYGSDVQCFLEVNKIKSEMLTLKKDVLEATRNAQPIKMSLTRNEEINKVLQNGSLGTIETETGNKIDMATGNISCLQSFTLNTTNAVFGRCTSSAILLGAFDINILSVFKFSGELVKEISLPASDPRDVIETEDNNIAVSFSSGSVAIINIENNNVIRTIKLINDKTTGLASSSSALYVSSSSGKSISIMDTQTLTVTKGSAFLDCAASYYPHITSSGAIIYCINHAVVCKTLKDEKILFKYTSDVLKDPRGIDSDLQGNIYIVGVNSRDLHQLTLQGILIRIIEAKQLGLPTSVRPLLVRFQPNSNKVLITSTIGGSGLATLCTIEKS